MTQIILSSMDSDSVNSISDTEEALQVANVIRTSYEDIAAAANLPEHFSLFELNASGDTGKPTMMTKPDNVLDVAWVQYNMQDVDDMDLDFCVVPYLPVSEFFSRMYSRKSSDPLITAYTHTLDGSSVNILSYNDRFPSFYTVFDDETFIFDAYNSDVDATLQKNKTLCYGQKAVTFTLEDDFVPDLDEKQFSLLLNEAKALAFAEIKQTSHVKAEKKARRGWISLQRNKQNLPFPLSNYHRLPDYGRK